jgi:DNA-directed RNA polymerase subunit RPC12/RpoP
MSDIFFKCTACGKYLVVDDDGAGVTTKCPACDASIIIPDLLIVHECSVICNQQWSKKND